MTEPDFNSVMRILAAADDKAAALPDADLIWERAAARGEWRKRESATRAIRLAERISLITCTSASVVVSVANGSSIETVIRAMDGTLAGLGALSLIAVAGAASILLKMLVAEE